MARSVKEVEETPVGEEKLGFVSKTVLARNLAIDEYFKQAIIGVLACDVGSRHPSVVAQAAMDIAVAAWKQRVESLGEDLSKVW